MKPILFNTEMVRAILDGRKTVTRRCIKPKYSNTHFEYRTDKYGTQFVEMQNDEEGITYGVHEDGSCWRGMKGFLIPKPKYEVGDTLYVREAWSNYEERTPYYLYKANYEDGQEGFWFEQEQENWIDLPKWKPSIHMPKEAARIFLRVTYVRVEKLQDIRYYEVYKEGIKSSDICNAKCKKKETCVSEQTLGKCHVINTFKNVWDDCYAYPKPVKVNGVLDHYESYHWEDIQETREYKELPWLVCGNPYVFVYDFEVISKEETIGR